jgi:hypothetical protein
VKNVGAGGFIREEESKSPTIIYMCGSFSFNQHFISESSKGFPTTNRSKPRGGEKLGKLMYHALASISPLTDIRLVENQSKVIGSK